MCKSKNGHDEFEMEIFCIIFVEIFNEKEIIKLNEKLLKFILEQQFNFDDLMMRIVKKCFAN